MTATSLQNEMMADRRPSIDSKNNFGGSEDAKINGNGPIDNEHLSIPHKNEIIWFNVFFMTALHLASFMGLKICLYGEAKFQTMIAVYVFYLIGGLGTTAGAHRLWSHRSYKATWQLRLILVCMQSMAYMTSVYEWCRDHRVHHKYSETSADPHDASRGFFFSHMGWLLMRKHPDVIEKGKQLDLSDLTSDKIMMFQHKYYLWLVGLFWFLIPTLVPYFLWSETLYNSFFVCVMLRYVLLLHSAWLVNSAAHIWGRRPYDKTINPSENRLVAVLTVGEGFHNYHHTFPWDYAASELNYDFNLCKLLIDFFALFGWAYDRKSATPDMIRQRKIKSGDTKELGAYGPYN